MTIHRAQTAPAPVLDTLPPLNAGRMVKDALAQVVDGNGLMPSQIRIAREDSQTHRLDGEISVAFTQRIQLDQVAGRLSDGVVVASEDAARTAAATRLTDLPRNAELQKLVISEINRQPAHGWGMNALKFTLGRAADDVFLLHEACPACATGPQTACAICAGSGVTTRRLTARYSAEITFTLWRQNTDVTALAAADALGILALARDDLADIYIGDYSADGTRLRAPCSALLPVARVDLSLEGRFVTALCAGKHGEIVTLDPVLDKFIKPGVAALLKLSRGPLAVESLLNTALKYRAVRQAVHGVLVLPRAAVYRQLQRDYPIGISKKYLHAAVKYADAAQSALAEAPRLSAARLACVAAIIIAALYFFVLRAMLPVATLALLMDGALYIALCAGCAVMIRRLGARKLTALLRAPRGPASLPAAGGAGITVGVVLAAVFIGMAMMLPEPPVYAQVIAQALRAVVPGLGF